MKTTLPNTNQMSIKPHPVEALRSGGITGLLERCDGSSTFATLLMPMEKKGAATRKNPIVFKNALNQAIDLAPDGDDIHAALEDLQSLDSQSHKFWQHQGNGLAMIVDDSGDVEAYRLPFPVEPSAAVGKKPAVSRLLPLLDDYQAYVLLLDLAGVRLFRAGRWDVDELDLKHGPASLEQAMRFDDPEKSLQFHTSEVTQSPGAGEGSNEAMFHGHGVTGDETREKKIQRFFEMLDKDLQRNLPDLNTPLYLFGLEKEVGLFRRACSYNHLAEESIDYGSANLSEGALEKKIQDFVSDRAGQQRTAELESLDAHLAAATGSTAVDEIVKAAKAGKIETLFIAEGASAFGCYDAQKHAVLVEESPDKDGSGSAENLFETAAIETFQAGGTVHYFDAGEMPDEVKCAAIFRY